MLTFTASDQEIALSGVSLKQSGSDLTPPDPARLVLALRQVGYSFEQAISDLIDNSINAGASLVQIRFICDEGRIRSVSIADNGLGMDAATLHEAMRFGTEQERDPASLGKYGMGLKLASLSHAQCVTVLTRRNRRSLGRRWTIAQIQKGWECERILDADSVRQLSAPWGAVDPGDHGTVVMWDEIDKLPVCARGLRETLRSLHKRLQLHLGLCFHRFLEEGSLRIFIDQQTAGQAEHSIRAEVLPLNPFGYEKSGDSNYPKQFSVNLPGLGAFTAEAHIWAPNAESPAYKLGNRAAARQGFYFYRNKRLIQAGGWNGLVQHETEPHSSLARIRIELPAQLDDSFGLNVQKSAVVVPVGFESAIAIARADDGEDFERYRQRAQQVYRKQDTRALRSRPLVPSDGLPKQLTSLAVQLLAKDQKKTQPVAFEWADLKSDEVFALGREARVVYLNKAYRRAMLGGARATRTDLPILKLLLFFLVEEDLVADRVSASRKDRLDRVNRMLVEAIRREEAKPARR
jgi:histidine kinase/DNA gyrase B/HSP90-like ATPase